MGRQYAVGLNRPGCLPDTTEALPTFDCEEDAVQELVRLVRETCILAVGDHEITVADYEHFIAQAGSPVTHDLCKALDKDEQFTVTVGNWHHFVMLVDDKPSVDLMKEGEVRAKAIVEIIEFIRRYYRTVAPSDAGGDRFDAGERNGLIFAILLVAGQSYTSRTGNRPGRVADRRSDPRPQRAWSVAHQRVKHLVLDFGWTPEQCAEEIVNLAKML